jgi:hypothetical protein
MSPLHKLSPLDATRQAPASPLVAAFEQNDQDAIRRLGWWEVWEAAATWWAPKQTARAKDLVPYVKLLEAEIPEQVVNAFRELAGDWRPTPSQVRGYLNAQRREHSRVDVGGGPDPASTPEAVQATAGAYNAGERPCDCRVRRAVWRIDAAGTLRCRACGGLEHGQVYAAEDLGLIEGVA